MSLNICNNVWATRVGGGSLSLSLEALMRNYHLITTTIEAPGLFLVVCLFDCVCRCDRIVLTPHNTRRREAMSVRRILSPETTWMVSSRLEIQMALRKKKQTDMENLFFLLCALKQQQQLSSEIVYNLSAHLSCEESRHSSSSSSSLWV